MSAVGFPDFRRQVDYDVDPDLSNYTPQNTVDGQLFGPFNVANFAYVSGVFSAITGKCTVVFSYYSDVSLTRFVGSRQLQLDSGNVAQANARVHVLGRFLQLTIRTVGGGAITYTHNLTATNRNNAPEVLATQGVVIPFTVVGIVAAGTSLIGSTSMGSGWAVWMIRTFTQPATFELQQMDFTGTYVSQAVKLLPVSAAENITVSLSNSPAKVLITNTGGFPEGFETAITQVTNQ